MTDTPDAAEREALAKIIAEQRGVGASIRPWDRDLAAQIKHAGFRRVAPEPAREAKPKTASEVMADVAFAEWLARTGRRDPRAQPAPVEVSVSREWLGKAEALLRLEANDLTRSVAHRYLHHDAAEALAAALAAAGKAT